MRTGVLTRLGVVIGFAVPLLMQSSSSALAQCPYFSVQARVQQNEQDPWKPTMAVGQGESFRVGAFKNGWGQFVDCCTTVAVTAPNGSTTYPTNGSYVTATLSGTYSVRASCGSLWETATVTSSGRSSGQTYDMLDYMMNDNPRSALTMVTNLGEVQVVRTYAIRPDRFYITKNYDAPTGTASEYEEYTHDEKWIYLVRDTSWQEANWCSGGHTSFELWTGERNRGARFPRWVTDGQVKAADASIIRARLEGNGCTICDSPVDSNEQPVTATYRFDKLASVTFTQTKRTLYDLIKVTVLDGPGAGEVYYYSKGLGFVAFESSSVSSYYSDLVDSGADFEVRALEPCPGQTGCVYLGARSGLSHLIGRPDGYDWSAQVPLDGPGYLSYGPYQTQWGSGTHYAKFLLWIDNNTANDDVVATIDVVTALGTRVLATRDLRRSDFSAAQTWQWFWLYFDYPSFEKVETRVFWTDKAYIKHGQQYICK